MAPASHMLAPVVRPEICARDWMIVPAARNATPAVTASMARMGSAVWPVFSRLAMIFKRRNRKNRGRKRNQHVGAQPRGPVFDLAVKADGAAEKQRDDQPANDLPLPEWRSARKRSPNYSCPAPGLKSYNDSMKHKVP